jgi:hypothetical protein
LNPTVSLHQHGVASPSTRGVTLVPVLIKCCLRCAPCW